MIPSWLYWGMGLVFCLGLVLYALRRKAPSLPHRQTVQQQGLHEADWFAQWCLLNDVQVRGPGCIAVANQVLSYALAEHVVSDDWREYDTTNRQRGEPRPTFLRSIKVVFRDWHQDMLEELGRDPPPAH